MKEKLVLAVPFQAALLRFTFFSNSKRVTDDDKKCVLIMFVRAAPAYLNLIIHYVFR